MLRMWVLSVVALVAAGCGPQVASVVATPDSGKPFIGINGKPLVSKDGIVDNSVQQALTDDPAAYTKAGGNVRPVCLMGTPMCVVDFGDGGKACSDGSECGSGRCRTAEMNAVPEQPATGICAATNDPCGCFQTVEDGKAGYPLCAD